MWCPSSRSTTSATIPKRRPFLFFVVVIVAAVAAAAQATLNKSHCPSVCPSRHNDVTTLTLLCLATGTQRTCPLPSHPSIHPADHPQSNIVLRYQWLQL
ncbi:hypothetical protein X798_05685 [Onchocerca flexuosa]|uniref:Secreted protein n=2 Tax=Onchocerca flexuosa TaxID=387005 RepID=A0A183I1H2_9BILA|nr:hypothetical protein X798_05685 [Onchocerca flexuosa]VDP14133.1 unnamed protein product [Onchocerca flexuosa]